MRRTKGTRLQNVRIETERIFALQYDRGAFAEEGDAGRSVAPSRPRTKAFAYSPIGQGWSPRIGAISVSPVSATVDP